MKRYALQTGDVVGVIAPSRPLWNISKEIEIGIRRIEEGGLLVKKGKNIDKHSYYSAGSVQNRCDDLHQMFLDKNVKAILCATGGASAIDLLPFINFDIIKENPKLFVGYSDITALLLAIEKNMPHIAVHGPNVYELSLITEKSFQCFINLLKGENSMPDNDQLQDLQIYKNGKGSGELIGGNITLINALLASSFLPDLSGKILFWEDIGESPAMLSFKIQTLVLSGKIKNINGMVIGHLSDCIDKKYPADNRYIGDIIKENLVQYDFPVVQWNHFGHDIKEFYAIPYGQLCALDTESKTMNLSF